MIVPVLLQRYINQQKGAPIKDKAPIFPAEEKKNEKLVNSTLQRSFVPTARNHAPLSKRDKGLNELIPFKTM